MDFVEFDRVSQLVYDSLDARNVQIQGATANDNDMVIEVDKVLYVLDMRQKRSDEEWRNYIRGIIT